MNSLVDYDSDEEEREPTQSSNSAANPQLSTAIRGAAERRAEHLMPSLVYIEVPKHASSSPAFDRLQKGYCQLALKLLADRGCKNMVSRMLPLPDQYVETPLHISLSRYFELDARQCDAFVDQLRKIITATAVLLLKRGEGPKDEGIAVSLEACQTFAAGEKVAPAAIAASASSSAAPSSDASLRAQKQRVFLGMLLGVGRSDVLKLIEAMDGVMLGHGFPPYYQPAPEPHCSFAAVDLENPVATTADDEGEAASEPAAKRKRVEDSDSSSGGSKASATTAKPLPIRTGDIALSPADLETGEGVTDKAVGDVASPCFAFAHICARIGKRLFRIPLVPA